MKRGSLCTSLAALVLGAPVARAHDGPPYPIVVDEDVGGRLVSIWADPDVGVGTFYVYLDPAPLADDGPDLTIAVRPQDDHAPEKTFGAVPAEEGEPFQLFGEVDFDRRGPWHVRFRFAELGRTEDMLLDVDVTPPGAGKIDLVWFLSPFALVAFLWVKVFLKRRELAHTRVPS